MPLTPYEGRDVVAVSLAITNAGDGLSAAMAVDPVELHHGQQVYIVIAGEVSKIRYDRTKDDASKLIRVQIVKAGDATLVDADVVADVLDAHRRKLDEARGVSPLPFDGGLAPELQPRPDPEWDEDPDDDQPLRPI